MPKLHSNHNVTSDTLFSRFSINKIFIKDKSIHVSGVNGHTSLFMSDKGFYDLDQSDIKNLIESLFDTLKDIQKENLVRQLTERREHNV